MPFPSDISLSSNSKYFGIVDTKKAYNLNWDVVWSFTYALTGTQHGFCSFLTTNPNLTAYPGQYLGYDSLSSVIGIGFDSTGYFALSSDIRSGLPSTETKPNSLVIRDSNNSVIFNQALSALDDTFTIASSDKSYKTLRFRYSNSGRKLCVDYKVSDYKYKNLATVTISSLQLSDDTVVYPGFSFCSPISSLVIQPSTMFVQNLHISGNIDAPSYEIIHMTPLTATSPNTFTLLSGISATPV